MSGRNNDERTGARAANDGDSTATVQAATQHPRETNQPGLNFVVPTEFVEYSKPRER